MKKKILYSIFLIVITGIVLFFYFRKETCTPLNLKRVNVSGDAQYVIGKSLNGKSILLTNLVFDKNDSTHSNIITLNGAVLGPGFNYGNFLDDSLMLVFDLTYKPFIFNIKSKQALPYKSQLKFEGKDLDDIQIVKFKGETGIALNEKNSILFENIKTGILRKIFDVKQLNGKDTMLVSFDILNDKIITCLKRNTESAEEDNYDFFSSDDVENKKIYSLTDIKSKNNVPKVKLINSEKYLISYFDGKSFIRSNNINSSPNGYYFTDGEILNTVYVDKVLYITLRMKTGEKSFLNNNLYKILYSGVNVYQVVM